MQKQAIRVVNSIDVIAVGEITRDLADSGSDAVYTDNSVSEIGGPTTTDANPCTNVAFGQERDVVQRIAIVVGPTVECIR